MEEYEKKQEKQRRDRTEQSKGKQESRRDAKRIKEKQCPYRHQNNQERSRKEGRKKQSIFITSTRKQSETQVKKTRAKRKEFTIREA